MAPIASALFVVMGGVELVDASTQVAGNHAHGRLAKVSADDAWFYKPQERGDARARVEEDFYAHHARWHLSARQPRTCADADAVRGTSPSSSSSSSTYDEYCDDGDGASEAFGAFVRARLPFCPPRGDPTLDASGYLRLGNIACGYDKPCVIDVKIGMRTWDAAHAAAYAEKRARSEAGTTHETLGFKICGAQTYDANGEVRKLSRDECKAIRMSESMTRQALDDFVRDPITGEANAWFWPALLKKLRSEPLRELAYRLVGTSLLVVYESGKLAPSAIDGDVCASEAKLEARYIDFCHAVRKRDDFSVDENFEEGLERFDNFVCNQPRVAPQLGKHEHDELVHESSQTTVFATSTLVQ